MKTSSERIREGLVARGGQASAVGGGIREPSLSVPGCTPVNAPVLHRPEPHVP